jgi:hypothetical protein
MEMARADASRPERSMDGGRKRTFHMWKRLGSDGTDWSKRYFQKLSTAHRLVADRTTRDEKGWAMRRDEPGASTLDI